MKRVLLGLLIIMSISCTQNEQSQNNSGFVETTKEFFKSDDQKRQEETQRAENLRQQQLKDQQEYERQYNSCDFDVAHEKALSYIRNKNYKIIEDYSWRGGHKDVSNCSATYKFIIKRPLYSNINLPETVYEDRVYVLNLHLQKYGDTYEVKGGNIFDDTTGKIQYF